MKIVLFGLAGTGKSSTAKDLAKKLNLTYLSSGNMMRLKAQELNLSINEFDVLCQKDQSYDLALDKEIGDYGNTQNNFIFESRLAWYFIDQAIKIMFITDIDLVYKRIAKRENINLNEAKKATDERMKVTQERFTTLYPDIIYPPKKESFDLIIDTTTLTIEETSNKIIEFLKEKKLF